MTSSIIDQGIIKKKIEKLNKFIYYQLPWGMKRVYGMDGDSRMFNAKVFDLKKVLHTEIDQAVKEERKIWEDALTSQRMDKKEEGVARKIGITINTVLDAVKNVHDNTVIDTLRKDSV